MIDTTTNKWLGAALEQHVHASTEEGRYLLRFLEKHSLLVDDLERGLINAAKGPEILKWGAINLFRMSVARSIRGYGIEFRIGESLPDKFDQIAFTHTLCNFIGYMLGKDVGDVLRGEFFPNN